jgi:DNA-binding transcriptional ArsR family regulator
MTKESFMLVSLREDKAKKLAQVISNPTCIKILDYLAGRDSTETQIAKDLKVPLSTVHYNLQQLVDAKLVIIEEFHYSEKGREVNHYKLANKYIIIAPQDDPSFLANLKKYLPIAVITVGMAVVLKTMQAFTGTASTAESSMMKSVPADTIAPDAAPMARAFVEESVQDSALMMTAPAEELFLPWWQSPSLDYFIAGAIFVLMVLLVIELVQHIRHRV